MNVEYERSGLLRSRAESWREERLIDAAVERAVAARLESPWSRHGVIVQGVFFLLTCFGMSAMFGLLHVLTMPLPGLFVGLGSLVVGEWLIRAHKWFGTGVESALWLGGLLAMIFELPSSGTPESLLVIAAAFVISGARVRNPLFGAVAAILVMVYAETRGDAGLVTGILIGLTASLALIRTWRRPSTEWLWIGLAVLTPIAARFTADERWRWLTIGLYAGLGAIALVLALLRRHHAFFVVAGVGFTIAAIDVGQSIPLVLEAKLALGGAFLLLLAFAVTRLLRDRTTGLTAAPAKLTSADQALEIAGALAAVQPGAPPPDSRPEGGGGFGGAGATGGY